MRTPIYQIAIILFGLLLAFSQAFAQEKDSTIYKSDNVKIIITQDGDTIKKRKGLEGLQISIGTNGVNIRDPKKKKVNKKLHTGMHFDFVFNNVVDNTNYRNLQNKFSLLQNLGLRQRKSILFFLLLLSSNHYQSSF